MPWRPLRTLVLFACGLSLLTSSGCQWIDQLKGPGFPGWEENQSLRSQNGGGKPSGMFFDRRSEQIESNLGINR
jgi:hypothetical protein